MTAIVKSVVVEDGDLVLDCSADAVKVARKGPRGGTGSGMTFDAKELARLRALLDFGQSHLAAAQKGSLQIGSAS